MKDTEIKELADTLEKLGFNRKLVIQNLKRCNREFIDKLNNYFVIIL